VLSNINIEQSGALKKHDHFKEVAASHSFFFYMLHFYSNNTDENITILTYTYNILLCLQWIMLTFKTLILPFDLRLVFYADVILILYFWVIDVSCAIILKICQNISMLHVVSILSNGLPQSNSIYSHLNK